MGCPFFPRSDIRTATTKLHEENSRGSFSTFRGKLVEKKEGGGNSRKRWTQLGRTGENRNFQRDVLLSGEKPPTFLLLLLSTLPTGRSTLLLEDGFNEWTSVGGGGGEKKKKKKNFKGQERPHNRRSWREDGEEEGLETVEKSGSKVATKPQSL